MSIFQHCHLLNNLPFDFEPNTWSDFLANNCYEYLLNYKNSSNQPLTVGSVIGNEFSPFCSNEELINILSYELHTLGFTLEETSNSSVVPHGKMKFFVSRSRCGDYHFYRLDSNGKWSHKIGYELPSNLDFSGKEITLPEYACSTDISVGYYILGIANQ